MKIKVIYTTITLKAEQIDFLLMCSPLLLPLYVHQIMPSNRGMCTQDTRHQNISIYLSFECLTEDNHSFSEALEQEHLEYSYR